MWKCVCSCLYVCVCARAHALGVWVCLHVCLHVCVTISVLTGVTLCSAGTKVRLQNIWMEYQMWSATHKIRGSENSHYTWLWSDINEMGWKVIVPGCSVHGVKPNQEQGIVLNTQQPWIMGQQPVLVYISVNLDLSATGTCLHRWQSHQQHNGNIE